MDENRYYYRVSLDISSYQCDTLTKILKELSYAIQPEGLDFQVEAVRSIETLILEKKEK
jgi:hypothetical protein